MGIVDKGCSLCVFNENSRAPLPEIRIENIVLMLPNGGKTHDAIVVRR